MEQSKLRDCAAAGGFALDRRARLLDHGLPLATAITPVLGLGIVLFLLPLQVDAICLELHKEVALHELHALVLRLLKHIHDRLAVRCAVGYLPIGPLQQFAVGVLYTLWWVGGEGGEGGVRGSGKLD